MKLLKLKATKTEMSINVDNVTHFIKQGEETKICFANGGWVVAPFPYEDVMHAVGFMADDTASL